MEMNTKCGDSVSRRKEKPIRVVVISGSYPPIKDGVGDGVHRVVKLMTKDADISRILLITSLDARVEETMVQSMQVRRWTLGTIIKILKKIKPFHPDIVHIVYPTVKYGRHVAINLLPMLLRLLIRQTRILLMLHEYLTYTWKGKARILLMSTFSHGIIFTDPRNRLALQRWCQKNKVFAEVVAPPQIPVDRAANTPAMKPDNTKAECTFGYWGFVRPGKGIETLLEAVALIKEKDKNPHIRVKLICELIDSNPYHKKLKNLIHRLGLESFVTVTGHKPPEQVVTELQSVDICVLPYEDGVSTRRGTFSAAMALGLPVITTIPDGENATSLMLEHGKNVYLIPPKDPNALAKAMLELAKDKYLRQLIGRNAKQWSRKFSWDKVYQTIKGMYLQLLRSE